MSEQARLQRKTLPPIFRMAVLAGVKASVQVHLRRGIDVNATDDQGRSPLILAASRGHTEICRLLLEAGANPAHRDDKGNDALAAASARGQADLTELLRKALSATAPPALTAVPPSEPMAWEADDAVELSAWEEETETAPPASDPSLLAEAIGLQGQISRHAPIDTDASWDEIDLDLPEEPVSDGPRAKRDADEESELRRLLVAALRDGRIQGWRIAAALTRSAADADLPDAELEANLRVVLGDLGVIIDDDPFAPDQPGDPGDEDDEQYDEEVSKALAFLRRLSSNEADTLSLFIRELPDDRLTREDEFALGMAIEKGRRDALVAVARCPAAMAELLTTAKGVASGALPLAAMVELDETEEVPPEELLDSDDAEQQDARGRAARPVPPEVLSRLSAVRELCGKLSEASSGPTSSKLSETLGEHLLALQLSPDFVDRLRRIVEADPHGAEARLRMEAGWEQVRKARKRLFDANLRLVIWVARKYGGIPLMDRIQVGVLGLMRAVERFDHRRGTKFSTYAPWWIRQFITRANADTFRTIRLPVHMSDLLRKVVKAQAKFFQQSGREATPEELAELLELPLAKISKLLLAQEEPVSMDSDEGWREVEELADLHTPTPEEACATADMQLAVRELLEDLSPKEATILRMRFGIGGDEHTLEEVGTHFGFTRERARQIEAKALRTLKHPGRIKTLEELR